MPTRTRTASQSKDAAPWRMLTVRESDLVDRYRKLLAGPTDEIKRLALIELLVEERAKERVEAEHSAAGPC